jgi:hypothetical protein
LEEGLRESAQNIRSHQGFQYAKGKTAQYNNLKNIILQNDIEKRLLASKSSSTLAEKFAQKRLKMKGKGKQKTEDLEEAKAFNKIKAEIIEKSRIREGLSVSPSGSSDSSNNGRGKPHIHSQKYSSSPNRDRDREREMGDFEREKIRREKGRSVDFKSASPSPSPSSSPKQTPVSASASVSNPNSSTNLLYSPKRANVKYRRDNNSPNSSNKRKLHNIRNHHEQIVMHSKPLFRDFKVCFCKFNMLF